MDQLSAHLDRGWDLAQKGDAAGALACARRALEIDPKSPEVHNLLGFASALDGDTDCAIEHYRQAVTLDETHFGSMLRWARARRTRPRRPSPWSLPALTRTRATTTSSVAPTTRSGRSTRPTR